MHFYPGDSTTKQRSKAAATATTNKTKWIGCLFCKCNSFRTICVPCESSTDCNHQLSVCGDNVQRKWRNCSMLTPPIRFDLYAVDEWMNVFPPFVSRRRRHRLSWSTNVVRVSSSNTFTLSNIREQSYNSQMCIRNESMAFGNCSRYSNYSRHSMQWCNVSEVEVGIQSTHKSFHLLLPRLRLFLCLFFIAFLLNLNERISGPMHR